MKDAKVLDANNWRVSTEVGRSVVITASVPGVLIGGEEVATIWGDSAVEYGLAHFIVRACRSHADLLAACEAFEGYDPYGPDAVFQWFELVRRMRATLARAKG